MIKTIADDSKTVDIKNPLLRWFFREKFKIALRIADITEGDKILDFGCGGGYLKRSNPRLDIVGYDINPEQTEIKDYTKMHPTKIFTMDVLEHISLEDIQKILDNFKKMNDRFDLIACIPTENLLSRKIRVLVGKSERVSDHITNLKQLKEILRKNFKLEKSRSLFSVSYIARYSYIKAEK
jgi:cyclopropane fatty-acyl-phospholipid synthase-like methyltransferase